MVDTTKNWVGIFNYGPDNKVTINNDSQPMTPEYKSEAKKPVVNQYVDPYFEYANKISNAALSQVPKISVSNGKIQISAPQEILDSPYVSQLKTELQSLKGADLSNKEVINSINKLNEEIKTNFQNIAIQNTVGWKPEEYNDYQYTLQTVSSSNPLRSSNKVKGRDKDGKIISKTPQEWVEYFRSAYNTNDRVDAYLKSAQSDNPYDRTMFLVLSQGKGDKPVYGFDTFERVAQGVSAAANQLSKFPEGTLSEVSKDAITRLVESDQKRFNLPADAFLKNNITSESQFSDKIQSLWGKQWDDLSDDDKAFVLMLSRLDKKDSDDRNLASEGRIKLEQLSGLHSGRTFRPNIENMDSSDAIARILYHSDYEDYKNARDNYLKWQYYQEDRDQDDIRLAKNAIMSSAEQNIGNFAGVVGRFLWEAAVAKAVTGGANVNAISDTIGENIVSSLATRGISPASTIGQELLQFTANLAGTIPEDIIQSAIDNVFTGNPEENEHLLDLGQMSENLKQNLMFMAMFNAARAGINAVKRARITKQLARQSDLNKTLNIDGISSDADDLARAMQDGKEISINNDTVSIINNDGSRKDLKNVTAEQVDMIKRKAGLYSIDEIRKATPSSELEMYPRDYTSNTAYDNFIDSNINGSRYSFDNNESNAITRLQSGSDVNRLLMNPSKYIDEYGNDAANSVMQDVNDLDNLFNSSAKKPLTLYRGSEGVAYNWDKEGKSTINTFVETSIDPDVAFYRTYRANLSPDNTVVYKLEIPEGQKMIVMPNDIPQGEIVLPRGMQWELTGEKADLIVDGKKAGVMYTIRPTNVTRLAGDMSSGIGLKQTYDSLSDLANERVKQLDAKRESAEAQADAYKYSYMPLNNALNMSIRPTSSDIKRWHSDAIKSAMTSFADRLNEFHDKFGDVRVSDFDWVWYLSKQNKTVPEIVGSIDPTTGREITQNMIDAMKWWESQPFVKDYRLASRESLGLSDDFNVTGYLPHTEYNPSNDSFEEAISGALWKTSTGTSVLDDNNNYKGYGGSFQDRYKTFVSNMLWDAKNEDVLTAKMLDEARMDGQDITPELIEESRRAVRGEQDIRQKVNSSESTKELMSALESLTDDSEDINWKKLDDNTRKQAEKSGLGQAIHDNYKNIYYGSNTYNVGKQGGSVVNSFDTLGNRMKETTIGNGLSMYDWGGADIVYAQRNAIDIVNRYMNEGGDLRDMLQEYVEKHSHRSPEYAEEVVDKWMAKIGDIKGSLTKAKVIQSLGNSMKWEGMTRLKKWLSMANYSQFNSSTRKMIDRFLFNHMQMNSIMSNQTISKRLTNSLSTLMSLRYRALFYGNIKNALLQVSELNRYFTSFKWGDIAEMAKRLALDENFRSRVEDYVQSVAPVTDQLKADLYQSYADLADKMTVGQDGVSFKSLGNKAKDVADSIGLSPINAAENFKNHMMVAGLVQEADRLGLSGDEALRHIRSRFERVALAADEMGQIGLASTPLARTMLFLQNFQIRELGMHLYNIRDVTGMAETIPKKVLAATNYLSKVFGSKLATTLIMARLGYSASQTMGIDPFGLLDNYNEIDDEDMEWQDYLMKSPFFAGGMTSLLSDMYFMARKAYEDSTQETVTDEAEQRLESSWGLAMPNLSFDNFLGAGMNFMPGNVFLNRLNQMNEMVDTGWATSASGNKMYTAPDDFLNNVLGYLFGRSATQNAQQYNQTYGDNLLQTLGRFNPLRKWGDFDPIDTKNYSDWFKGDSNDAQQFEKGRRFFRSERDRIINEYEQAIRNSYASDDDISEAKNSMNNKLDELFNKLEKFVDAYEEKNGTITPAMTKQIISILNTGQRNVGDTAEQASERSLDDYSKALERYSNLGLSPVGTYTGATESEPEKETKYQGSPQYRSAINKYYGIKDEATEVLKMADVRLKNIRKEISQSLSNAYDKKDYDTVEKIQREYLKKFDQVVAPIIAAYGNGILGYTDVTNQIKDMLSTGTNSRSGNLIPSDDYRKDKNGRFRSMPFETVDVKKWALQRYSGKIYQSPTVTSYSTASDDIRDIRNLLLQGKKDRALARALQLKARVNNQTRVLSKEQLKWLNKILGGNN